ncbi:MAG: hypothetical protein J6S73_05990, partial [Lentisphaeria bacterium]|nr:hypothetical protein [Lentisphaeria bacterium]
SSRSSMETERTVPVFSRYMFPMVEAPYLYIITTLTFGNVSRFFRIANQLWQDKTYFRKKSGRKWRAHAVGFTDAPAGRRMGIAAKIFSKKTCFFALAGVYLTQLCQE